MALKISEEIQVTTFWRSLESSNRELYIDRSNGVGELKIRSKSPKYGYILLHPDGTLTLTSGHPSRTTEHVRAIHDHAKDLLYKFIIFEPVSCDIKFQATYVPGEFDRFIKQVYFGCKKFANSAEFSDADLKFIRQRFYTRGL